jgi:hypothetical protein
LLSWVPAAEEVEVQVAAAVEQPASFQLEALVVLEVAGSFSILCKRCGRHQ